MIKNCLLVATILTLVLTACSISIGHADWIDFVQFNGIKYLVVGGYIGGYFRGADARDVVEADRGPEFARVEYKHPSSTTPFTPEGSRMGMQLTSTGGSGVHRERL